MKALPLVLLLSTVAAAAPNSSKTQPLTIRVTPAMAFAPALLTVRATVEPSSDNRRLNVEIDSPAYHRTSEIPLDGANAPRLNVLELKNVPTGLYEVRVVLEGPSGPIATTMQLVRVEPAAGQR